MIFKEAIDCLNQLQSNAATLQSIQKSGGRLNEVSLPEMREYWSRLGHTVSSVPLIFYILDFELVKISDLNHLNAIHVAGTKGKGSTCAFADAILKQRYTTGLYTSPHLVEVRERIRINGHPLTREQFAHYFFEVYTRLDQVSLGVVIWYSDAFMNATCRNENAPT